MVGCYKKLCIFLNDLKMLLLLKEHLQIIHSFVCFKKYFIIIKSFYTISRNPVVDKLLFLLLLLLNSYS